MTDFDTSEVIQPTSIEEPGDSISSQEEEEQVIVPRSVPAMNPLNLGPPPTLSHLTSPRLAGSPLKNVMLQSPTHASPLTSPISQAFPAPVSIETQSQMSMVIDQDGETLMTETSVSIDMEVMSESVQIDDSAFDAIIPLEDEDVAIEADEPAPAAEAEVTAPLEEALLDDMAAESEQVEAEKLEAPTLETEALQDEAATEALTTNEPALDMEAEMVAPNVPSEAQEAEDGGPDLLGGLEAELDRQTDGNGTSEAPETAEPEAVLPPAADAEAQPESTENTDAAPAGSSEEVAEETATSAPEE
jgi:hypothetical protein